LGTLPADALFARSDGRNLALSALRGRPTVVSFVYTSCPHVCPTITNNLKRVTDVAAAVLGEDAFNVVTIGFDVANDTPGRMASYARERGIEDANWYFLSADEVTIGRLTTELGFTFEATGGGFEHLTQVTLLDADGRVYRQVYGADMETPMLVEPLKRLAVGERFESASVSALLDGVRLICSVYDPASGRYRFDYSIVVTVLTGVLSLGAFGVFLVRIWRTA
jgi:protein SCO1/2